MGWTAPRDWTAGEVVTEAMMDAHVKNNLRYLKGLDGVPTTESGLIIDNTDGDEYVKLPLLSTAECATVLNAAGEVAYDEATNRIKMYGATLNSVVTTADVDDSPADSATTDPISSNWAYDFINTLTAEGDIPYASGAGTWTKLAKGTAGQTLVMNGTATAPAWAASQAKCTSGQYTGNSTADRAITHGLGVVPKFIRIVVNATGYAYMCQMYAEARITNETSASYSVTAPDATDFHVGNATSYEGSANVDTGVYNWVAIG